jgi:1-acyl-sn-glycerol-3-phosphate acyltransferase
VDNSAAIRKTSVFTRLVRCARLTFHLFVGLYIIARHFPKQTKKRHAKEVRRWSRQILAILGIRARAIHLPVNWPARCMLISNHVSWIDVFAILSVRPSVFVAKAEIRSWPFIGTLVAQVGTLFIERGSRLDARRANERIVTALESGTIIAVCPEGATNATDTLLKFHPALFQPAIDARAVLQPVAIRYFDAAGQPSMAAAYVGTRSLVGSIWSIATEPRMTVELRFGTPTDASEGDRRALAVASREQIGELLKTATHTTERRWAH